MNIFEKYYGKSDAELSDEMKELTLKKVKRGFGSTIDQLEGEKIKLEKKLIDFRIKVANGSNENIINLGQIKIDLIDLNNLIETLDLERTAFIGK